MKRTAKRTPLINRGMQMLIFFILGYYSRVVAIELLVERFINRTGNKCQLICLGGGYDTLYFRLHVHYKG